ncbi:MAG: glycosyltransferase family 2 protein [Chloracidobacterium sp.]|nr:glycosyltransferase family 2 protein [Chloracidobacterium sp.]
MNELPVSVIIPTYNRANLIARSLDSVLAAIAPGDEVIVVDDGSTDGTPQTLEPYRDRIRYLTVPHRGVGAARNRGVAVASNPLVAFNDSDDEWFADKLELQRTFMRARPDVLFCFTDLSLRYVDGTERRRGLKGWHRDSRSWDEILGPPVAYSSVAPLPAGRQDFNIHIGSLYETMLRRNYVPTQATVVRRGQAGDALCFGEDVNIYEDYECFIRLARVGKAAYFDRETVWQNGHKGSRLTDANTLYRSTCRINVLRRTYGADDEFLAQNNERYLEALKGEYLTLARCLISNGCRKAARKALLMAQGAPLSLRMLAAIPGPLARTMFELYRLLSRLIGRSSLLEYAITRRSSRNKPVIELS